MTPNDWETRVQKAAKAFTYPPTPDIAANFRQQRRRATRQTFRRLAQIAVILLLVLLGLMAVPQIRAQVLAFFRIGAVEVIVTTVTPSARFSGCELPDSVLDFPGATTLADAQRHAGYPIRLPAALPAPDRVFLIQAQRPIVVLAWLDAKGAVDVSLHLLPPETYAFKMTNGTIEPTHVNSQQALWIGAQHWYMLQTSPTQAAMRQVNASALIWETADGITYRLETNRPEADAIRIAESIPTTP